MIEILTANKYYKNTGLVGYRAPGYIVLVNGNPTHLPTKKAAEDFARRLKERME